MKNLSIDSVKTLLTLILSIISTLNDEYAELEDDINKFELDPDDYTDEYDSLLDQGDDIIIQGMTLTPSHVLKNVDEVSYREGLFNYVNSIDYNEVEAYKGIQDRIEEIDSERFDLYGIVDELNDMLLEAEASTE